MEMVEANVNPLMINVVESNDIPFASDELQKDAINVTEESTFEEVTKNTDNLTTCVEGEDQKAVNNAYCESSMTPHENINIANQVRATILSFGNEVSALKMIEENKIAEDSSIESNLMCTYVTAENMNSVKNNENYIDTPEKYLDSEMKSAAHEVKNNENEQNLCVDILQNFLPIAVSEIGSKKSKKNVFKKYVVKTSMDINTEENAASSLLDPCPLKDDKIKVKRKRYMRFQENYDDVVKPLELNWKREIVHRATTLNGVKTADVYYKSPVGKKLRSLPEVEKYINSINDTSVKIEWFTFNKKKLTDHINETERQAFAHSEKRSSAKSSTQEEKDTKIKKRKMSPNENKKEKTKSQNFNRKRKIDLNPTCGSTCPGYEGRLPDVMCVVCYCFFHPNCVGILSSDEEHDFTCPNCASEKTFPDVTKYSASPSHPSEQLSKKIRSCEKVYRSKSETCKTSQVEKSPEISKLLGIKQEVLPSTLGCGSTFPTFITSNLQNQSQDSFQSLSTNLLLLNSSVATGGNPLVPSENLFIKSPKTVAESRITMELAIPPNNTNSVRTSKVKTTDTANGKSLLPPNNTKSIRKSKVKTTDTAKGKPLIPPNNTNLVTISKVKTTDMAKGKPLTPPNNTNLVTISKVKTMDMAKGKPLTPPNNTNLVTISKVKTTDMVKGKPLTPPNNTNLVTISKVKTTDTAKGKQLTPKNNTNLVRISTVKSTDTTNCKPLTSPSNTMSARISHVKTTDTTNCKSLTPLSNEDWTFSKIGSVLSRIFNFLNTKDLLHAKLVCKSWREVATDSRVWKHVLLQDIEVTNWDRLAEFLKANNVEILNMRGLKCSENICEMWRAFSGIIPRLTLLKGLVLCKMPASISYRVAVLNNLQYFSSEAIFDPKTSMLLQQVRCKLYIGKLKKLTNLRVLKVRGVHGLYAPEAILSGGFNDLSELKYLQHLSITSFGKMAPSDLDFLINLPDLSVLELGDCFDWTDEHFNKVGQLTNLTKLRLEYGGQKQHDLFNVLKKLIKLKELELVFFQIPSNFGEVLMHLKQLESFAIWPYCKTEGPQNSLKLITALERAQNLKRFIWGLVAPNFSQQTNAKNTIDNNYCCIPFTTKVLGSTGNFEYQEVVVSASQLMEEVKLVLPNTAIRVIIIMNDSYASVRRAVR